MVTEFDYELTHDQWEALKALRLPASERRALNRSIVEGLIALELARLADDRPILTQTGRKVLVRGSSRLWDVAA
jgi:hypothetical protein